LTHAIETSQKLTPQKLYAYLWSDYETDPDYVDGVIEERPLGEDDHALWQGELVRWFQSRDREWDIRVRPALRVQVSATRFRVPDVAVLDRKRAIEQVVTHPPFAVFEILSPEDGMERMLVKLADYAAMGIQNIFVIDPETQIVYRFVRGVLNLSSEKEMLAGSKAEIDWAKLKERIAEDTGDAH
jgi:Uma2 family endonuclease